MPGKRESIQEAKMAEQTYSFLHEFKPREPGQLDFYCWEQLGAEILRAPEDTPILRKNDLLDGMPVYFFGLFGEKRLGSICKDTYGNYYVEDEDLAGALTFGGDARECWICYGLGDKAALANVNLV